MARPVLIMDIGSFSVRAGVFSHARLEPITFHSEEILLSDEGTISPLVEIKDAVTKLLSVLRTRGFHDFHRPLVSVPATEFSFRVIDLPFEDRKKIVEVLPFELVGYLHIPVEEAIMDAVPIGGKSVLAISIEKRTLKDYLSMLNAAGIDPFWIGTSALAVPQLLSDAYGAGTRVFINRDYMVASSDGKVVFVQPATRMEGIRLGVAYLGAEGVEPGEIYSSGMDLKELAELFPSAARNEEVSLPGGFPGEGAGIFAIAHLMKKGDISGVALNFRKGEFKYVREYAVLKKRLKYLGAAAGLAAALAATDLYLRYAMYSRELSAARAQLRAAYLQLFPGERAVADETYQLESKLRSMQKEAEVLAGGINPLKVLKALAEAGSAEGAAMNEVNVAEGRVRARGDVKTFDAANRLRDRLSRDALFTDARLSDAKAGTKGVTFTMDLVLR